MAECVFFIPCSVNFREAVKDRTASRYWKLLIDTDGDGVLEDMTTLIDNNQITGGGKTGGQSGEAIANQYKVKLRNPGGILKEGDLAGCKCAVEAKVGNAEYIRLFTGFVTSQGVTRSMSVTSSDAVSVDLVDFTKNTALNRKTERKVLVNHAISDPASPGGSIFHKLVTLLGLTETDLDMGDRIGYVKPYLPFDGNSCVFRELQDLAMQYLAILTFRYDGKLRFRSRFEDNWQEPGIEWTFDETNVHKVTAKGGNITCNRVKTEFDSHQVLDLRIIHQNVEDYNVVTGKINITVGAGDFWPGPGGSDKARLSYREPAGEGEEYPIGINIQTPTIGLTGAGADIECSGGLLELESFNGIAGNTPTKTSQNADSSEIILYNNTASPVIITRCQLRGQPVRIAKKITVEDIDPAVVNEWEYRDKSIPGRYAVSENQAHQTTQWWVEYGKVKRKDYELETDWLPQVQEGAKVLINLPALPVYMVGIVESYTHPAANGPMTRQITKLTVREDYAFTPSGAPTVITQNMGYAGAENADAVNGQLASLETALVNRPTYQEMQEGYTQGGGVVTPDKPVILICQPVASKAVMLVVNIQGNLTNFLCYEWQVSGDEVSWYALCFDGTDWKGALDAVTSIAVEFLTHCNIPHTGSGDDPHGRQLFYRVRRVTKVGLQSVWSNVATAVTNTVAAGDLAAGSVYVNNLVAGIVNAMIAQLNSYLEVGGDGFVGKTYGKTSGYQECGLIYKDRTIATGLMPDHTYYFKITVDGGNEVEYNIAVAGDTTYGTVINLLNNAVTGCLFDMVNGDLRCSSVAAGSHSSIALAAGTSGDDLFTHLTGFSAFEQAVAGSDNPIVWGATRSRVFEDSWIIEFWNGMEWTMILKGGGRYNGELFPYIQSRGLVAAGAESVIDTLDFGEKIPAGSTFHLFRFDASYTDQSAADPWDIKLSLPFLQEGRKFGTHCLIAGSDYAVLQDNDASGITWGASFCLDFWYYIPAFDTTVNTFFKLGSAGNNTIHFHSTIFPIFTDPGFFRFAYCQITESLIAVVFKTPNTGLEVKAASVAADNQLSWGLSSTVSTTCDSVFYMEALGADRFLISYRRLVVSSWQAFVTIGTVSGTVVSLGDEQAIETENDPLATRLTALDATRIALVVHDSVDICCRIATVSGGEVVCGQKYSFASALDNVFAFAALNSSQIVICYRENSSGLLKVASALVTGEEISFSSSVTAGESRDVAVAEVTRLDDSSFVLTYTEAVTYDVYVRRGYLTAGVPAFNTEYALASGIDSVRTACYPETTTEDSFDIIFNLAGSSVGGGVLKPAKVTGVGVWTFYADSAPYAPHASEAGIIARNNLFSIALWSYNLAGASTLESLAAAKDGYTSASWQYRKNFFTGSNEILFRFAHSDAASGEMVSVCHTFGGIVPGWQHQAVSYDSAVHTLSATLNNAYAEIDLSSYSLGSDVLLLACFFMLSCAFDDLLVFPGTCTLTCQESLAHYRNNVRWSIDFDFRKDVVICPAPGGTVYFPVSTAGKIYAVFAP